jgi:ribonuclease P protein component
LWPFLLFIKGDRMKFSESLKKNKDFQNVYRKGKSQANKYLVMYLWRNDSEKNRLGISVSKKVGNSVVRHRVTRLIRESYRLNEDRFQRGYDFVVIARPQAKSCGFHEIESALIHMARIHKVEVHSVKNVLEEKAEEI